MNKLSLINYLLQYNCKNKIMTNIIDFIINYDQIIDSKILKNYEINGENIDLVGYILTFLNDDISDNDIYRLCLDLATFLSNYSILKDKVNKIIYCNETYKNNIKSKMLTNI